MNRNSNPFAHNFTQENKSTSLKNVVTSYFKPTNTQHPIQQQYSNLPTNPANQYQTNNDRQGYSPFNTHRQASQGASIGNQGQIGNSPFGQGMANMFGQNHQYGQNAGNTTFAPFGQGGQQQWVEMPMPVKKIKVDKSIPWTRENGEYISYTVVCLAYQQNYRKSQMSTIQIRGFSYLQKMGLLNEYLSQGYAAQAKNKLARLPTGTFFKTAGSNKVDNNNSNVFSSIANAYQSGKPNNQTMNAGINSNANGKLFGQGQSQLNSNNYRSNYYPQNTQGGSQQILNSNNHQTPFNQMGNTIFGQTNSQNPIFNQGNYQNTFQNNNNQSNSLFPFLPKQNTGIFGPNQNNNFPQQIQQQVPYNPQIVQAMQGPILDQIGQYLMNQRMLPMMQDFLASYGITEGVLAFLFGMGLSPEEVKEFLIRRFFLRQIDVQRARRLNFLDDYYIRGGIPEGRSIDSSVQNRQFSRQPFQDDKFSRYVDYVLEKSKYNWEDRILHDNMKEHLKSNVSQDMIRQQKIKNFLNQLEEIEEEKLVDEEFKRREQRLRDSQVINERESKSIWASEEDIARFGLNTPMRVRPYYLP